MGTYFGDDDIAAMLDELGVDVSFDGNSTRGLFENPDEVVLDGSDGAGGVIGARVVVTIKTGSLPGVTVGVTIIADGTSYLVRKPLKRRDGALTSLLLSRGSGATDPPLPGGAPVVAHAAQHETGGTDPITSLDAAVITSGALTLSRGGAGADLSEITPGNLVRMNLAGDALEDAGTAGGGAASLPDLVDVVSAATDAGFALIANGTGYVGRAILEADIADLHTRYTDAEADARAAALIAAHAADAGAHHTRYTDAEADARAAALIAAHAASSSAHHARYTDTEARSAMGTKLSTNPLHHDRYTDAEARSAVGASDLVMEPGNGIDATGAGCIVAAETIIAGAGGVHASSYTGDTFDGRDLAVDGAKLDGIESGATADQTAGEIKTGYESNADTNAYTDAEKTKLAGVESGATADQTAGDILALGFLQNLADDASPEYGANVDRAGFQDVGIVKESWAPSSEAYVVVRDVTRAVTPDQNYQECFFVMDGVTSTSFITVWVGDTDGAPTSVGGQAQLIVELHGVRTDDVTTDHGFVYLASANYARRATGTFDGWWLKSSVAVLHTNRSGGASANVDAETNQALASPTARVKVNSGETWQFRGRVCWQWSNGS